LNQNVTSSNLAYKEKYNHVEKNLFEFVTADLTY